MNRPIPLSYAITELSDALEARVLPIYDAHGVTGPQFHLLDIVATAGPLRQGDLAKHGRCVKSNISYLVAGMERDGWLARTRDPEDSRAKIVMLTDEGRARYERVVAAIEQVEAQLLEDIGEPVLRRLELSALLVASSLDQGAGG